MTLFDLGLRWVLALFPRGFRERQAADMRSTVDDWLDATSPDGRGRTQRQILWQLLRAAAAERLSGLSQPWMAVSSETPSATPTTAFPSSNLGTAHASPIRAGAAAVDSSPEPSPYLPRHVSRSPLMEDLMHDFRSALRSLTRRPTFALLVIATLGLGLGASAAMFGVVNGVLLKPLPYDEPDRLVTVFRNFTNEPAREAGNMSMPDLLDVSAEASSLESVAGYGRTRQILQRDGQPELLTTGRVTAGLLKVFGLEPLVGRDITAADAVLNAPKVVVLGHGLWGSHFANDPTIVGKTLILSGDPYEVVGVAPEGFEFPQGSEIYLPWQIDTEGCGRDCHLLDSVARLAPGVAPESASLELQLLGEGLSEKYPESNLYKRFAVRQLQEQEVAPVQSALWLLLGAVQLVVLIAAANVANLVLVRGARRRRELAIRVAIGAGRARLFRQLMLENALLAAGGAMAGLLIGQLALGAFLRLAPPGMPRVDAVGLDATVFGYTIALSLVVLLVFGLTPALRMASSELRGRGQAGSVQAKRSRRALLTAEVALALILLLGAGLLVKSFVRMGEIDLGFSAERVTRFAIVLPDADYPEPEDAVRFSAQLEERLLETPGVEAAGLAFAGAFGDGQITSSIQPLDRPEPATGEELAATFDVVTPGLFETLQIPIVRGRAFTEADTRQAPLALLISESLAESYYPGKNPVGERAKIGVSFDFDDEGAVYTIVGVVADVRAYMLTEEPRPAVYMAQAQSGCPYLAGVVRTHAGVEAGDLIRDQLRALDPAMPIRSLETQTEAIAEAFAPQRFYSALLGSFAAMALLLSAVGLYGVVAYLVSQRTRELAVRMALGANAPRILRLVLADALKPTLVGIALGLVGAFLSARALEGLLYGVTTHDAATYILAPVVLIGVAFLAALSPALRAARLEPRLALQED